MISDELIKEFASGILVDDVTTYIDNHKEEYKKWLSSKDEKKKKINNEERIKKDAIYTTKK
ncbi:MAG: hypothetical protein Q4C44_00900 [bacterium]|nr:hypothetical protein [bacterium]